MAYAEETKVPIDQTRSEIEKRLKKAGGIRVVHVDEPFAATVMFMLGGRLIRFELPIDGKATDQQRRSRWRGLLLVIKAKLEAIESKIATVEQEFLAHVVLPDGQTVGQWFEPQLQVAFDRGTMPMNPLLLSAPKASGERDR